MKNIRKALLAVILTIPLCLQAQVSCTHVVTYDFESGEVYDLKPVKYHDFVVIKIININTFRYGVGIEGRRVDYTTPMPTELQAVFRVQNDYNSGSEEAVSEGLELAQNAETSMQGEAAKIKEEVKVAEDAAVAAALLAGVAPAAIDPKLTALNEKTQDLERVCKLFLAQSQKIARIRYNRMELISISKQNWKKHSELKTELYKINVGNREQMRTDFENYYELYAKAEVAYEEAQRAATAAGKPEDAKLIREASEKLEESYTLLHAEHYLQLIDDVRTLYDALGNKNNFIVHSAPVQMIADVAEFEINISPVPTNALLPIEQSKTALFEIATRGGVKIDFSVGPAAVFKTNSNNVDNIIDISADPDNDANEIINSFANDDLLRPATAAYMHVMTRANEICSYGLLFGLGTDFQSVDDIDLSLYTGLTLGLGKTQRVYLSGGVSFYRTDVLDPNYDIGQSFPIGQLTHADITRPNMQSGAFISISYALANRVQIQ